MSRGGRYARRKVPATTNNITRSIINFLNMHGHCAARINTQGQWDEAKQIWRKSGSTKGVFDIICCLRPFGRMLIVDVKKGDDELREDQIKYQNAVLAAGGIAYGAKSAEEFEEYYLLEILPQL